MTTSHAISLAAALVCASACSSREPQAEACPAESSGGEPLADRIQHNVDQAQKDFQEAVEPAAEFVDEKTREAVSEGKRAFRKVTGREASAQPDEATKPPAQAAPDESSGPATENAPAAPQTQSSPSTPKP